MKELGNLLELGKGLEKELGGTNLYFIFNLIHHGFLYPFLLK